MLIATLSFREVVQHGGGQSNASVNGVCCVRNTLIYLKTVSTSDRSRS